MNDKNIISIILDNDYLQIIAKGNPLHHDELVTYKKQNYRVLRCHPFIPQYGDTPRYKVVCLLETTKANRSYNN